jgi:hypothetical protein
MVVSFVASTGLVLRSYVASDCKVRWLSWRFGDQRAGTFSQAIRSDYPRGPPPSLEEHVIIVGVWWGIM